MNNSVKNCESAGFVRPVSVGMRYRTSDDVKDGFGNRTGSCRDYTLPRAHTDYVVKLWIKRHTEIGPVLEVKTFCHMESKFKTPPRLEIIPMLGGHMPRPKP